MTTKDSLKRNIRVSANKKCTQKNYLSLSLYNGINKWVSISPQALAGTIFIHTYINNRSFLGVANVFLVSLYAEIGS